MNFNNFEDYIFPDSSDTSSESSQYNYDFTIIPFKSFTYDQLTKDNFWDLVAYGLYQHDLFEPDFYLELVYEKNIKQKKECIKDWLIVSLEGENNSVYFEKFDSQKNYENVLFCVKSDPINNTFTIFAETAEQEHVINREVLDKNWFVCYSNFDEEQLASIISATKYQVTPIKTLPFKENWTFRMLKDLVLKKLRELEETIKTKEADAVLDCYYKSRHEILLMCCCYSFSIPYQGDVEIPGTKLTPDIFIRQDDYVIIGDISVSWTSSFMRKDKQYKYDRLKFGEFRRYDIYVCMKPDLSDINFAFNYPKIKMLNSIPYGLLNDSFSDLGLYREKILEKFERSKVENIIWTKYTGGKDDAQLKYNDFFVGDLNVEVDNSKDHLDFNVVKSLGDEDIAKIYGNLLDDKDIYEKYSPKKISESDMHEISDFVSTENNKYKHFDNQQSKPSFHVMLPFFETDNDEDIKRLPSVFKDCKVEQKGILSLFKKFIDEDFYFNANDDFVFCQEFARNYYFSCLSNGPNREINNYGEDYLSDFKEIYHENITKTKHVSFFDYARENLEEFRGFPEDNECYFTNQKIFRIPKSKWSGNFKEHWTKSGNSYKHFHDKSKKVYKKTPDGFELVDDGLRESVDTEYSHELVNDFIDYMSEMSIRRNPEKIYEDFGHYEDEFEDPKVIDIKKKLCEEYSDYLKYTFGTRMNEFHHNCSMVYDQLLHFNGYSINQNRFAVFSCGIPNFCVIVALSYTDKGKDIGAPFMCLGTGPKGEIERFKNMFGKVSTYYSKNQDEVLYITNWRRLPGTKLTFLRDTYYSVLSSGVISAMRDSLSEESFVDQFKRKYVLRSAISLCSNQRLAEMLMDLRYFQVALFSMYTNIVELVKDKFSPPYNCHLIGYIIELIRKSVDFYRNVRIKGSIVSKSIVLDDLGRRVDSSVGFNNMSFSSFFGVGTINNEQDLLDDMFLYVHTMKEPSSMFYEEVKAVRTIFDFQQTYDKLSDVLKGSASNFQEFKDFYKKRKKMGFISNVIYNASKSFISGLKPDMKKIITKVNDETLSKITSTKSVIGFEDRFFESLTDDVLTPEMEKHKIRVVNERIMQFSDDKFVREKISKYSTRKELNETRKKTKIRSKVHDVVLNILEDNEYNYCYKISELVQKFIDNDKEVVADICIKAQYGSKREFYVMNIVGKLYTRIFENLFKELCELSGTEMISVAGDEKIIRMQTILNDAVKYSRNNDLKMVYLNGDCTKWSAAEIMQSFMSMIQGFEEILPKNCYNYLLFVCKKWCKKKIQIPQSILKNVFPIIEGTEYLEKLDDQKRFESTQNFLQGVFNYCSSLKAVICAEYTQKIYQRIFPYSKCKYFHMEHSDDYAGVICYDNNLELNNFKTLHTMIMGACSMTDSAKKTTIQTVMFEFVSLMAFNSSMTYPSIKKTKEVGTNVACVGYAQDMYNIGTRTSELLRIGVPQTACYLFTRIHNICLRHSYSVSTNMRNDPENVFKEKHYNIPVELGGSTNMLPCFYLLSKGDPNNYRLYKYGDKKTKGLLKTMIYSPKLNNTLYNQETGEFEIWSPYYMFSYENKLIKKIRESLDVSKEDADDFWKKYISYNFLKPDNKFHFKKWLKFMYFKKSFSLAYNRISRLQMSLRISRFASKNTLKIDETEETYSMKETFQYVNSIASQELEKNYQSTHLIDTILLKGDDTTLKVYSWFSRTNIFVTEGFNRINTVAGRLPHKSVTVPIDNHPGIVLEAICDHRLTERNNRKIRNDKSLTNDVKTVKQKMPNYCDIVRDKEQQLSVRLRAAQVIYTVLELGNSKRNVCMLTNKNATVIDDFMLLYHTRLLGYYYKGKVRVIPEFFDRNIHSGELSIYNYGREITHPHSAILGSLSILLGTLFYAENLDRQMISEVLNYVYTYIGRKKTSVKDYLTGLSASDVESSTRQRKSVIQLAFLKAFLLNDNTELKNMLFSMMGYRFKYDVPQEKTKNGWIGDCVLSLVTFDKISKFYLKNGMPEMYTEHRDPYKSVYTFLIGLEKVGLKKSTDMFDRQEINITFLSAFKVTTDKEMIRYNARRGSFEYSKNNDFKLPITHKVFLEPSANYEYHNDNVTTRISIDNNLTVKVGNYKFFRLPILRNNYYSLFTTDDILINEIKLRVLVNLDLKMLILDKPGLLSTIHPKNIFDSKLLMEQILAEGTSSNKIRNKQGIIELDQGFERQRYKLTQEEDTSVRRIKLKKALEQGKISEEEYMDYTITDRQLVFNESDLNISFNKIGKRGEGRYGEIQTNTDTSENDELKESKSIISNIISSMNQEEDFEFLETEDHKAVDFLDYEEGEILEIDEGIKINVPERYFSIEYKKKFVERKLKKGKRIYMRILLDYLLGEKKEKTNVFFLGKVLEFMKSDVEFMDNDLNKCLLLYYNNVVKEQLEVIDNKIDTGSTIFYYDKGEVRVFKRCISDDIYSVEELSNFLESFSSGKRKKTRNRETGEIIDIKKCLEQIESKKRRSEKYCPIIYLKEIKGDEKDKRTIQYLLNKSGIIKNTVSHFLFEDIEEKLKNFSMSYGRRDIAALERIFG